MGFYNCITVSTTKLNVNEISKNKKKILNAILKIKISNNKGISHTTNGDNNWIFTVFLINNKTMGEKIVHLSPCDDMKTINSIKLNKSIPFAIVSFIYIFK